MPLLPPWRATKSRSCRFPVPLHRHREPDVRAVEPEHELFDRAAEQPVRDVVPGHLVGGRRQRGEGNARKQLPQPAQVGVFRPEGRAPLRDAVGLVDGEQRHRQPLQCGQHALGHQPFRGHVEQPCLPRRRTPPGGKVLLAVVAGVNAVRRDAGEPQRRHLVLHQRHQRRHHDRETVHDQGRDLEAERLARARRHHRERVPARQQRLDHRLLPGTEPREAEYLRQHPARGLVRGRQRAAPVAFSHRGSSPMTAPVTASHEAASGLPRGRRCAPTVRSRPIYHPVRQASTRPRRRRIQLQAATEPVTAADVQSPPCGTPEPNRGPPSRAVTPPGGESGRKRGGGRMSGGGHRRRSRPSA